MPKDHDRYDHLPTELRALVRRSVALLGEVIRHEAGDRCYRRIEAIRGKMASLRGASRDETGETLRETLRELRKLSREDRAGVAHSFTLMLELMNACENAYRSFRLRSHPKPLIRRPPDAMIYVVTAHPTEARSPENIELFHRLQNTLTLLLAEDSPGSWARLRNELELAWHLSVAKQRRPQVRDEADHIYSLILREENIRALLAARRELGPIFIRSWVGGDKDGHPGVSEVTLRQSLQLSRGRILRFFETSLREVRRDLALLEKLPQQGQLLRALGRLERSLRALRALGPGDGRKVTRAHADFRLLLRGYESALGALHPALSDLRLLIRMTPALVIPMELRESSELIHRAASGERLAIGRMLETLSRLSRGASPRFYARGLIISMTSSLADIEAGMRLVKRTLRGLKLPVIPLFEQHQALLDAPSIVKRILDNPSMRRQIRAEWDSYFEVMLGYSDSAKESGALMSRLSIMEAVLRLDRVYRRYPVTPVFFHGSGGSTDRGGGTIEEQIQWWPESARRMYKATIQGEMVERAFASPEITRRRFEQIALQANSPSFSGGREPKGRKALSTVRWLASQVSDEYRAKIASPSFLEVVQKGTAYRYLSALKIGSRPTRRTTALSVSGLRAIPWVLCWTQARVLFPTWWGVGTAWRRIKALPPAERRRRLGELRLALDRIPVFSSYVKILASTLARVELPVWRIILENSDFDPSLIEATALQFEREHAAAVEFVRELSGHRDLLWFRPWFGESIRLRSPMIHPLNLLQILAIEDDDTSLLRETVTGISSGMMTTG